MILGFIEIVVEHIPCAEFYRVLYWRGGGLGSTAEGIGHAVLSNSDNVPECNLRCSSC